MKLPIVLQAAFIACLLLLYGCGGGGSAGRTQATGGPSGPQTPSASSEASLYDRSRATVPYGIGTDAESLAGNPPANTDRAGRFLFIGTPDINQAARRFEQNFRALHDDVDVGHLQLRGGVSARGLQHYLRADAADQGGYLRRWGDTPPTVRMLEGSTGSDTADTLMAVRLINSALPPNWQLRFDNRPAAPADELNPGFIDVAFTARENWPGGGCGGNADAVGCAVSQYTSSGRVTAAAALVDPVRVTGERQRIYVLLHEILHALGRGHVSREAFPDTIMHESGDLGVSDWRILSPLDEAALYAVHARLRPGTPGDLGIEDFGPWSNLSTHAFGRLGAVPGSGPSVVFGAVWQNGLVRPYATGRDPSPPLERRLSGSAGWEGRAIGLTPEAETVAGAVAMVVQLASLHGEIDFTGLEAWPPHAGPGALGTGAQWGDGDLHYGIALSGGRVFVETGGDEGEITGAFFGSNQQRMGGTLRRRDLSAGFAGDRR